MFRGYIEPSLSLALKLLLIVPHYHADVHQCIGKLISSLITTIGPELQGYHYSICVIFYTFHLNYNKFRYRFINVYILVIFIAAYLSPCWTQLFLDFE